MFVVVIAFAFVWFGLYQRFVTVVRTAHNSQTFICIINLICFILRKRVVAHSKLDDQELVAAHTDSYEIVFRFALKLIVERLETRRLQTSK